MSDTWEGFVLSDWPVRKGHGVTEGSPAQATCAARRDTLGLRDRIGKAGNGHASWHRSRAVGGGGAAAPDLSGRIAGNRAAQREVLKMIAKREKAMAERGLLTQRNTIGH